MRVIPPITLNSTNIVSNAPTTGDPAITWDTTSSYIFGQQVKVLGTVNKMYECISATGTTASDDSPEIDCLKPTPKWFDLGSINKYKMFDNLSSSYTTGNTSLAVTLTPGMSTSALAITHLNNVTQVVINGYVTHPTIAWTRTFTPTVNYSVNNSTIYFDIPSNITVFILTFTGTGTFYIGNIVVGNTYYNIGRLQDGTISSTLNFSSTDRDTYGNVVFIERRSITKVQHKVFIDSSNIDTLLYVKDLLNAIPAVWSGLDDSITHPYFSAVLILGFYREFHLEIDNPIGPMINIEIEEV